MKLKINGQDQSFVFGVKFLRKLDAYRGAEQEIQGVKVKLGMGLTMMLPQLMTKDSAALADVLYCAAKSSIKLDTIDDYIDNCKYLDSLFNRVMNEIKASNAAKPIAKNLKAQMVLSLVQNKAITKFF